MKFLLASNGKFLIEEGYNLLGIPVQEIRIGWVTTASKGVEDLHYLDVHREMMQRNGYKFQEIDIERKSKDELYHFFEDKNIIHGEGGNTFYLLKVMKETGFDIILKDLITRGKIYVGTSAGAYVACPTIEMATWKQNTHPNYGLTDFTALNLVPFLLIAHYKDEMHALLQEKIKSASYPVRALRDGQGIMVEDGEYRFMGQGEEVRI